MRYDLHKTPEGWQYWTYTWVHIQTGSIGTRTTDVEYSRLDFLEMLNQWNRQGKGRWAYYG